MAATRRPYLRSERTISQYTALRPRHTVSPTRSTYALAPVSTTVRSSPAWYTGIGPVDDSIPGRRTSGTSPQKYTATSPVRYSSPGRRRVTSPARMPVQERQADSTMQLPVRIVVESMPPRVSPAAAVPAVSTDQDEDASAALLEAQLCDQLHAVGRNAPGSPSAVCPRCLSETTRLYAGRVCPRCLDFGVLRTTLIADRSPRGITPTVPLVSTSATRSAYTSASRRSEIELAVREAEAQEAERRLQAVLRRNQPVFAAATGAGATSMLTPRRGLEGGGLVLGFASRSSPRLDQLLADFPDDSPTRANYRTPHARGRRSPDSRLAEPTVAARTLSFSPLPD